MHGIIMDVISTITLFHKRAIQDNMQLQKNSYRFWELSKVNDLLVELRKEMYTLLIYGTQLCAL